jgi:ribosomal protein S2
MDKDRVFLRSSELLVSWVALIPVNKKSFKALGVVSTSLTRTSKREEDEESIASNTNKTQDKTESEDVLKEDQPAGRRV